MKNWLFGCAILFLCVVGKAQEKFGALHSNYSPTNSVHINPSSMLDAKTWLDIHIIGSGAYFNNNYAAIENSTWINTIGSRSIDESQLLYNTNRNRYHAYSRSDISALSAVFSQGDHAFGLSFNGFSYIDVRRLDNTVAVPLSQFLLDQNVDDLTDLEIAGLRLNAQSYGEVKLSYAHTYQKIYRQMLMFGVSVKQIFPFVGGAAKVSEANYAIEPNDLLSVNRFQGDVAFNTSPELLLLGGMGIDLGFTYQHMKDRPTTYFPNSPKSGCRRKFYQYKIGVSLIDFGVLRFRESTTESFPVSVEDTIFIDPSDDIETTLNSVNTSPDASSIRRPSNMSLPRALSLQFDYNVWNNMVYVNATIVQGIPHFGNVFGVRRANSLSITPRFESKWFDVAIPFSLYEYIRPQLGLSMRLRHLTIGTDKLLSIFVPSDLYGADVYAQLKVPIFRNPQCKDKGFNSKKSRRKRSKLCEAYW